MAEKKVSENLCKERSGNILDKISDVDRKLDKFLTNHAPHMEKDSSDIKKDIILINKRLDAVFNKFENEEILRKDKEKRKNKFQKVVNFVLPILVGIGMKVGELALKAWGLI